MMVMIPEDVLCQFQKDEEYRSSLKEFCEASVMDEDEIMLDADSLRRRDTWNEFSGKEL
jgi:hypothetical protein